MPSRIKLNMSYVNNILTISTLSFVAPIQKTILKKRWFDCFLLSNVLIFSLIHHLVETNEAGHNLEGNWHVTFLCKCRCHYLRYLDMFFSYTLFLYIIYKDSLFLVVSFLMTYKIVFLLFLINFICDFIICNSPNIYLCLHFIWHLGISTCLKKYYDMK